jgi:hypothetical protein
LRIAISLTRASTRPRHPGPEPLLLNLHSTIDETQPGDWITVRVLQHLVERYAVSRCSEQSDQFGSLLTDG